jgi:hypothetical protein
MDEMTYEDGLMVAFYQSKHLMVKIQTMNSIDMIDRKATEKDVSRFPIAYSMFAENPEAKFVEKQKKQSTKKAKN